MFHDLRDYDGQLIILEISKFDVKTTTIPNGLRKYMAFTINKNFVFIDSMECLNLSLDTLVKNLSETDFKYLSQGFSSDLLKLVKQKRVHAYKYMGSFKNFFEDKLQNLKGLDLLDL